MSAAEPIVRTEHGAVSGLTRDGVHLIRNIPFAAPPVGARRFAAPVDPEPWDGVRPGTRSGPGAVQLLLPDDPWNAYFNPAAQGEDCLTLEVSSPDLGAAGLPVLVWIHGGAFIAGAGSAPAHNGRRFAEDGIVHVAVNYRLSVDGFLHLPDSSEREADNLGLRDQIAALHWVRRNIARFGGDPGQVTVMGQSAGAMSVAALLVSPAARGLFHAAVLQSPFLDGSRGEAEALALSNALLTRAGTVPDQEALRQLTHEGTRAVIRSAQDTWAREFGAGRATLFDLPFQSVHDTPTLPAPLSRAASHGEVAPVPVLIGSTRDELAGFIRSAGLLDPARADLARAAASGAGATPSRIAAYREGPRPGASDGALLNAVWTDRQSRLPSIALLERHRAAGYLYEFRWQSPATSDGIGSEHTLDIPFVRDDFASLRASGPIGAATLGDHPPQQLATAMHRAFADFVRTGDPGWPAYRPADRMTMVFDETSTVVPDAARAERALWS